MRITILVLILTFPTKKREKSFGRDRAVTALLLAAGTSSRLYPLTKDLPKCLLPIGDRPLLDHLWDALDAAGVSEKVVVTGYRAEQIQKHLSGKARFVHNPDYARTNNLASFQLALEQGVRGSILCLHTDVLIHPEIIQRVLKTGPIVLAADRTLVPETMKVQTEGDRLLSVGKSIPAANRSGTFLGIARLDQEVIGAVTRCMDELDEETFRTAYFTAVLDPLIREGIEVRVAWMTGLPWCEIDTLEDLERARREVLPEIQN